MCLLKLGWSGKCLLVTSFPNACGWPLFWTWAYVFEQNGSRPFGSSETTPRTISVKKSIHFNGFTLEFYENCQFTLFQRTKGTFDCLSFLPAEDSCSHQENWPMGSTFAVYVGFRQTCLSAALHTC